MNTKWVVGITIAAIVLVTTVILTKQAHNKMEAEKNSAMMMEEKKDTMEPKDNAMMKDTSTSTMEGDMMMEHDKKMQDEKMTMEQKPGAYKDYSQAALAEASKDGGKVVLFFWASWCPYCKAANEDFTNNTSQIPAGVTVLKVNYDTEKELKTKYGVTYQHTFVQVDANGNQITKWNGGGVKELIDKIK